MSRLGLSSYDSLGTANLLAERANNILFVGLGFRVNLMVETES